MVAQSVRQIFQGSPVLSLLPATVYQELDGAACEQTFPPGAEVVREGSEGDTLYIVVTGRAEVTATSDEGPRVLAALGPGDTFGELAILDGGGQRYASLTALTALVVLALEGETVRGILREQPRMGELLGDLRERMLVVRLLKQASPLALLTAEQVERLVGLFERMAVPAGSIVVRQGEAAESCYLLRSGSVRVVKTLPDGAEAELAVLEAGALFGERALLTASPRNSSVWALTDCELLVLHRDDLTGVLQENRRMLADLQHLIETRECLTARPGVQVEIVETESGRAARLKDPASGSEYSLSVEGHFLWTHMDGSRTIQDLVRLYLAEFGSPAPNAVGRIVRDLAEQGFLEQSTWRDAVLDLRRPPSDRRPWRVARLARGVIGPSRPAPTLVGYALPLPPARPAAGSLEESVRQYQGVRTQMARVVQHWERQADARAVFLRCYWTMTGAMLQALEEERFGDPTWVFALLNRFADFYFDALTSYELVRHDRPDPSRTVPEAWRLAFALTEGRGAGIVAQLLCGVNAHINRDLPFVLYELFANSWAELSEEQRQTRHADYDLINDVIAGTADAVQHDVVERYGHLVRLLSRLGGPASTLMGSGLGQIIVSWRDDAWGRGLALVGEADESGRQRMALEIEHAASRRGRILVTRLLWWNRLALRRR
jgi:CRP-like cAMP-binding protein